MATKLGVYQEVCNLVGVPALVALTDQDEIRHVLDVEYAGAVDHVLRTVPWRFALRTASVEGVEGVAASRPGYSAYHAVPATALRVTAIYLIDSTARRLPFDCRLEEGYVFSNVAGSVHMTFVSTAGRTETLWTEGFTKALCAYLAFKATQRITALNGRTDDLFALFQQEVQQAAPRDAVPEDPWIEPQISGRFMSSARYVLEQGAWKFALRSASLPADGALTPMAGFSHAFQKPADWLRTQGAFYVDTKGREIPVDFREHGGLFSANVTPLMIRYVSEEPSTSAAFWPEQFYRCVAAHLGIDLGDMGVTADDQGRERRPIVWPEYLQRALSEDAEAPNPWLSFQTSGQLQRALQTLMEKAHWRFALVQVSVSADAAATPLPGYSCAFPIPADHVRTRGLFRLICGEEYPADIREASGYWSANVDSIVAHYVSRARFQDPANWPSDFIDLLGVYLGIYPGGPEDPRQAQGGDRWAPYLEMAAEKLAVAESPWLAAQVSGRFIASVRYLLGQGSWKFALASRTLPHDVGSAPMPGFPYAFDKPADFLRTHAVYYVDDAGREIPVDFREHGGLYSADVTPITVRYVSSALFDDASLWPEDFYRCVGAHLGIDLGDMGIATDENGGERRPLMWPEYLQRALEVHAEAPSPWMPFQISGAFQRAVETLLEKAHWRFALEQKAITFDAGLTPMPPYVYAYPIPEDHLRTRGLFISTERREHPADIREAAGVWSANASGIIAHYVSRTKGMNPANWPSDFIDLVGVYLGLYPGGPESGAPARRDDRWAPYLEQAKMKHAVPESPWLRHQISGAFPAAVRAVLWEADWTFASKTETLTHAAEGGVGSYAYTFDKPYDWGATVRVFKVEHEVERDLDFREQGDKLYADFTPIQLKYIQRSVIEDPTTWPEYFDTAVLAWLAHREAMGDKGASGAVVAARKDALNDALRQARGRDDIMRQQPRVNSDGGAFTSARLGYFRGARKRDKYGW